MHSHMAYISNMINEQAWGEATNEDQCKIPDVQETKHKLLLFCAIWIILQNSKFSLQPLPSSSDTVSLASAILTLMPTVNKCMLQYEIK